MVRYTADLVRSLWWETSQVKRDLDGGLTLEDVCTGVPVLVLFHSSHVPFWIACAGVPALS